MLRLLNKPFSLLLFSLLGIAAAHYFPNVLPKMEIIENIYLSFLNLCLFPILVFSIFINIQKIKSLKDICFKKTLLVVFTVFVISSLLGILTFYFFSPSLASFKIGMNEDGTSAFFLSRSLEEGVYSRYTFKLSELLDRFIPLNIYESLMNNSVLEVLFLATFLGASSFYTPKKFTVKITAFFTAAYDVLILLYKAVSKMLPLILFIIFFRFYTGYFEILKNSYEYLLTILYAYGIIFILCLGLISLKTKSSPWKAVLNFFKASMIALTTNRVEMTIPPLMFSLEKFYHIPLSHSRIVLPAVVVLGQFIPCFLLAFVTVAIGDLYTVNWVFSDYILIVLTSIFIAFSVAGLPYYMLLVNIPFIFSTVGLPLGVASPIFYGLVFFLSPVSTLLASYVHATTLIYLSPKHKVKK